MALYKGHFWGVRLWLAPLRFLFGSRSLPLIHSSRSLFDPESLTPAPPPPPPHLSFSRQIGLDAFLPIRSTRPSNPKLTRHLLDDRPSRTRFPHQSKIFTPPDLSLTTYPIRIRTSSPHDRELVVLSSRITRRRSWRDGWKASRLAVQRGNRDWLGLLCIGVTSDRSGEEYSMMGSELFLVIIIHLYACPIRSFQSRVLYEITPHNRRHRHD